MNPLLSIEIMPGQKTLFDEGTHDRCILTKTNQKCNRLINPVRKREFGDFLRDHQFCQEIIDN